MTEIFQGEQVRRQIDAAQLTGELNAARAEKLRREAGIDATRAQEELNKLVVERKLQEERLRREQALTPYAAPQADAELRQKEADILNKKAEEDYRKEQTKKTMQEIDAGKVKLEVDEATRDAIIQGKLEENKPYKVKNTETGETVTVLGKNMHTLLGQAARERTIQLTQLDRAKDAAERLARVKDQDANKKLETAAEMESNIVTPPRGGNATTVAPYTEVFNAVSERPYVYVHVPAKTGVSGIFSSPSNIKVDLAPFDGKPVTGRMVYERAKARGMTTKEYLEKVYFPQLGEVAPWLK